MRALYGLFCLSIHRFNREIPPAEEFIAATLSGSKQIAWSRKWEFRVKHRPG